MGKPKAAQAWASKSGPPTQQYKHKMGPNPDEPLIGVKGPSVPKTYTLDLPPISPDMFVDMKLQMEAMASAAQAAGKSMNAFAHMYGGSGKWAAAGSNIQQMPKGPPSGGIVGGHLDEITWISPFASDKVGEFIVQKPRNQEIVMRDLVEPDPYEDLF